MGRRREIHTPAYVEILETIPETILIACAGPGCVNFSPYRFCSKLCRQRSERILKRVRAGRRARAKKKLLGKKKR
jgi:hypothetical protein